MWFFYKSKSETLWIFSDITAHNVFVQHLDVSTFISITYGLLMSYLKFYLFIHFVGVVLSGIVSFQERGSMFYLVRYINGMMMYDINSIRSRVTLNYRDFLMVHLCDYPNME